MADGLIEALEHVQISGQAEHESDDWIDSILDEQRPRKRMKQDPQQLKDELEQKFLTPSTKFTDAWLNRFQQ